MEHEEEFIEAVKDAFKSNCFRDKEGNPYVEIYADYRDELDDYHLKKFMEAGDPRQAFYESMYEWYEDYEFSLRDELVDKVMEDDGVKEYIEDGEEDEARELAWDRFFDYVYIKYPDDHFLDQNICVDILVDTGDANYDFTCNNFGPHYDARENEPIPKESSLLWLAKQQGYTKSQLKQAMKERPKEQGFLQSVYDEINNVGSHMSTLTFLVEMTFGEYLDLLEAIKNEEDLNKSYTLDSRYGRGYITIWKKVVCGLFDEWNGGGSILEIKLDKDVKLPIRYIFKAKPDCCLHYDIKSVYDCCSSLWTDAIKEVVLMHRKRKEK